MSFSLVLSLDKHAIVLESGRLDMEVAIFKTKNKFPLPDSRVRNVYFDSIPVLLTICHLSIIPDSAIIGDHSNILFFPILRWLITVINTIFVSLYHRTLRFVYPQDIEY